VLYKSTLLHFYFTCLALAAVLLQKHKVNRTTEILSDTPDKIPLRNVACAGTHNIMSDINELLLAPCES